ncbi:MAG TPA: mechanosensitive ion channel family protein [Candidatus Nitrosotenuis sp.]|nr:mechanosensitive ion channel family protein [Candidatus Nitrosotenuis sp.]
MSNSLTELLPNYLDQIIASAIIVIGAIITYYVLKYFLGRSSKSLGIEKRSIHGMVSVSRFIITVVTIVLIIFQFSTTSGIVASALSLAGGTIVGFASINTVGNAIAGILLLLSRPFKIGDRIRLSDDDKLLGDVVEITLIYTKIKTVRNELICIPNQILMQRHIVNYSSLDNVALVVEISLSYNEDRNRIESLLLESAAKTQGVLDTPTSQVLLVRFDSFAAVYQLRCYTDKPNQYQKLQSDLRKNVYDAFKSSGLSLTTPNVLKNS